MDTEYDQKQFEPEIGDEPPDFSIGSIINMFRTRGFIDTINDEVFGPHVHLFLLLSVVLFITIIIGLVSLTL
ncbi:hypothetical protein [[Eubacterium] cellulosolvens]